MWETYVFKNTRVGISKKLLILPSISMAIYYIRAYVEEEMGYENQRTNIDDSETIIKLF